MKTELRLLDGHRLVYELDDCYTDPIAQSIRDGTNPCFNEFLAIGTRFAVPRSPTACVVDVGANLGCCALAFALRGHRVYAFEAAAGPAASLRRAIADNGLDNIVLTHAAVGRAAGRARFHSAGPFGHLETANHPQDTYEDVAVVSLDGFFEHLAPEVGFVKIDVEGSEIGVLEGARNFLTRVGLPPIEIEVNSWCLKWFGQTSNSLFRLASRIGYRLFRFETEGLRPVEPDFLEPVLNIDYLLIAPHDLPHFVRHFIPPMTPDQLPQIILTQLSHPDSACRGHAAWVLRARPEWVDAAMRSQLLAVAADPDPYLQAALA